MKVKKGVKTKTPSPSKSKRSMQITMDPRDYEVLRNEMQELAKSIRVTDDSMKLSPEQRASLRTELPNLKKLANNENEKLIVACLELLGDDAVATSTQQNQKAARELCPRSVHRFQKAVAAVTKAYDMTRAVIPSKKAVLWQSWKLTVGYKLSLALAFQAQSMGVDVEPSQVMLAGYCGIEFMKRYRNQAAMMLKFTLKNQSFRYLLAVFRNKFYIQLLRVCLKIGVIKTSKSILAFLVRILIPGASIPARAMNIFKVMQHQASLS